MPTRALIPRAIRRSGSLALLVLVCGWLTSLAAPLTPPAHAWVPGPTYEFLFDEPSGTTSFPYGAVCDPNCPTLGETGQHNTSALFPLSGAASLSRQSASVSPDTSFTISTWYLWEWGGSLIEFSDAPAGPSWPTSLFTGVDGRIYLGDGGGAQVIGQSPGGWTHVTVSCDAGTCTGYVNGEPGSTVSLPNAFISSRFRIAYGFNGHIDLLRIYSSAVTAEQAAEIFHDATINDPPLLSGTSSESPYEGQAWHTTSPSIQVLDVDAGSVPIRLMLSVGQGTITLNGASPGGIVAESGDFTGSWTRLQLLGPQDELNAALRFLAYNPPNADFDCTLNISVSVDDLGSVGDGGSKSASDTKRLTYLGINDAPTFSVADVAVNEDAGSASQAAITAASPGPACEASQTVSFPITGNTNPSLFSAQPLVSAISGVGPRSVSFTPAADLFGSTTITLSAQDDGLTGGSHVNSAPAQSFTLTVRPVNDAPLFTKGANQELLEDAGPQVLPGWATGISPGPANESEQSVSFLVGNSNNALFSQQPSIDSAGALRFTSAPDAYGLATVVVRARDTGGTANGGQDTSAPQTFTINVLPVNDAPVNTVPPDELEVVQSRPVYFTGLETFSLRDVDIYGEPISVTLHAEQGVLSLAQVSGLSFASGDGIEDATLRFTGVITSVNAALASLDFFPTPDYLGPASVTITADDQGAYGQGGPLQDSDTLAMVVNRVNEAPAMTFPGTTIASPTSPDPITFALGSPPSLYPASIPVLGINGTVRKVTVTLHELRHSFPADLDVLLVAPSGKAVLLMSDVAGSMDMDGVTLTFDDGAIAGLPISPRTVLSGSYRPTNYSIGVADTFPAPAPSGPYAGALSALVGDDPNGFWRLMVVDDYRDTDAGVLAGGWSMRIVADGLPYTGEGQDLVFSSAGGNPISLDDPDSGASPVAVSLAASAGTLSLGRTSGLSFYTGDGDADQTMSFSGSVPALNAALEGLRFSAPTYSNTQAEIRFALDDQGYYGAGGARVVTETLKVFVNPVIDSAPGVANLTTDEDTQSGPISVGPGPADGAEVRAFQISAIGGGLLFLADGATPVLDGDFITAAQGAAGLRFTPDADSNAPGSFHAQGTLSGDALGLGGPISTATVTVSPVNDPPTLASLADVVMPAEPGEQSVDLAGIATGAPNEGDTLFVSATSSDQSVMPDPVVDYASPATGGRLRLTAPGQVGSATITVRVLDSGTPPRSVERSFVVVVGRLNDLPVIDPVADLSIDEDSGAATVSLTGIGIGAGDSGQSLALTATSSDPAILPDPTVSYTSPQAVGSLRLVPLPNAHGTVTITLSLLDNGHPPLHSEASFRVTVRPINDAPSFVKGLSETLDSNIGPRSIQLWATRINPGPLEPTQSVRFELVADHPELFSAQPAVSGDGTLSFTPQRNVEGVAIVSVTAVDDGGTERGGQERSSAQSFRIILLKDNLPPTFTLGPGSVSVDEDFTGERAVTVTPDLVPESERGQVVSYRLSPASVDFANVALDPRTGKVTIMALQDGYGEQVFTLIASDGQMRNHTARQSFTLTVSPINDPPALAPIDDLTIVEDSEPRVLALGGISAGPFSEAQPLSVTAVSSDPTIMVDPAIGYDSPDGVGSLTLAPLPEQNGVVTITVRVADNGTPALLAERSFQVTVTAVNDAPTIEAPLVLYAAPGRVTPLRRIEIADKDSGPEPVLVTLRVSSGQLTVSESVRRGVTAAQISGNGSARVALRAPIAAIRFTLADRYGLIYEPRFGFIGPDPLKIEVDDQGHTGGNPLSAQTSVPLNIEPLADLELAVQMREIQRAGMAVASTGITREYSVEVENKGPSTATGVALFAQVPDGARLEGIDPGGASCSGDIAITCEIGAIEVKARVRLTFVIADAPQIGAVGDLHFQLQADQIDPSELAGVDLSGEAVYLPHVRR